MENPAQPAPRVPRIPLAVPEPRLRPASASIAPDFALALAVAAITLLPLTRGASLLLAPAAWIAAAVQIRRRRRRGERIGERLDSALGAGRLVTVVVGALFAAALLVAGTFWAIDVLE